MNKPIYLIRIIGGHYSNVYYDTKKQAQDVLKEIPKGHRNKYEFVKIMPYEPKNVTVN